MSGSDFKLDVDALFGEQVLHDPESIDYLKRGTRTRPRKTSLTHGKSFMKLCSAHLGMDSADITLYENKEMEKAEIEQTKTDKFWGLDKEFYDKLTEISFMAKEDSLSQQHELFCKIESMKKSWEDEEIQYQEYLRNEQECEEENARNIYLRAFYAATDSGDIMSYPWPTRDTFPNPNPENGYDENHQQKSNGFEIWNLVGEPSTIHLDGLQQSRTISLNGETHDPRKTASIADLAMRPVGTRKNKPSHPTASVSSHHNHHGHGHGYGHSAAATSAASVNGIYSVDSPSSFLGMTSPPPHAAPPPRELSLPSLHSSSTAASASPLGPGGAASPGAGVGAKSFASSSSHNQRAVPKDSHNHSHSHSHSHTREKINLLELHNSKYLTESNKLLLSSSSLQFCDLTDGHPVHHWDSTDLLRAAFSHLDILGSGFIRREHIAELGNNRLIHQLLRYTLFFMSLKRREWQFFYAMFDDYEETMGVDVWLAVAEMMRREEKVRLCHVRTIQEHQQACAMGTLQLLGTSPGTGTSTDTGAGAGAGRGTGLLALLGEDNGHGSEKEKEQKKFFASEQRKRLCSLEREASLLRDLRPGDFVWGLYRKGCVWLPAVVETISLGEHTGDPSGGTGAGAGVGLKYLLTTEEVKRAQALTISRQYLPRPLPSSSSSALPSSSSSLPSTSSAAAASATKEITLPQSIRTEKELCGHVFDLILNKTQTQGGAGQGQGQGTAAAAAAAGDLGNSPYLSCKQLITSLRAPEFSRIVLSSAHLSALFDSRYRLCDRLETLFAEETEAGEAAEGEGGGLISRTEFIEFCDLAKDIFVYNIATPTPAPLPPLPVTQ